VDEIMVVDTYAYMALGVYFLVAGGFAAVIAFMDVSKRDALYGIVRKAIDQARQMSEVVFAPLPDGRFFLYGKGQMAGAVDSNDTGDYSLAKVERIALVKDMHSQTGLVVTIRGKDECVTGLEEMARIYSMVQRDDAPVAVVFREDAGQTMNNVLGTLDVRERSLIGEWITDQEIITDVIHDVDYEGTVQSAGSKGVAKLVVTNLRVGLLAQTVQTESVSGGTRTTTHYNLISYLLPLANRVILERTPKLSEPTYLLHLDMPAEHTGRAPVLKLTKDHTGVFLPMVIFNRPVEVRDTGPGVFRVVFETLKATVGWGILFGALAAGGAAILSESGLFSPGHWQYRYAMPLVIAGALTPGLFRFVSILGNWLERRRMIDLEAAA
jgi:hypothetical protein